MLLEVILEDEVTCPRCPELEKILRRICRDLDIPFSVKFLGNKALANYEESVISRTLDPEWVKTFGSPEHKRSLEKIEPLLRYMKERSIHAVPNTIIRWHAGTNVKEIVIRGFNPNDKEQVKAFVANLYALLKSLKRVVYGR